MDKWKEENYLGVHERECSVRKHGCVYICVYVRWTERYTESTLRTIKREREGERKIRVNGDEDEKRKKIQREREDAEKSRKSSESRVKECVLISVVNRSSVWNCSPRQIRN